MSSFFFLNFSATLEASGKISMQDYLRVMRITGKFHKSAGAALI